VTETRELTMPDELHRDRVLLSDGEVVEVIAVRDDSTMRGRRLDQVAPGTPGRKR
jgi:hypothetical protein